jgi:hypothetical protein
MAVALLGAAAAPTLLLAQAAEPLPPTLKDVAKAVADNGPAQRAATLESGPFTDRTATDITPHSRIEAR